MAQKLGEIKKPPLTKFHHVRKLFCLPLIPQLQGESIQEDLQKKVRLFWQQATKQISDLERTGKTSYLFIESITSDGEAVMDLVKQINEEVYHIVEEKCAQGAKLVVIEDKESFDEHLDWSMCLSVVRRSQKVVNQIIKFHGKAAQKRYEHIAQRIDDTLEDDQAGLLIMTDDNRLRLQPHLPSDIQVFLIHPPALNDVQRWFRDYLLSHIHKTENAHVN